MVAINLKKLITQKEVRSVLTNLVNVMAVPVCIEDNTGKALFEIDGYSTSRYPIQLSEETIGWVIGDDKVAAIAEFLTFLAQQHYEKKLLANELLEKYQELDLFHDFSTKVTASLDLKEVARLVIEEGQKLIQSTSASIFLLDRKSDRLEILWEVGTICWLEQPLKLEKEIIHSLLELGQSEIINDIALDSRFIKSQTGICSLIFVPLISKEQVIGAIALGSETSITYSTEDLKLLTMLAVQTAVAIEKALLYEQSCLAANTAQEQAQQLQRTIYELQETQTRLLQSEKMSSLGQLVADVAHDINNPITCIGGNLGYAQEYTQGLLHLIHLYQQHYPQPVSEIQAEIEELELDFLVEDLGNVLSSMHASVERIRHLVSSLRNFSRLDQLEMTPLNIHEGIDSTLMILNSRLKPKGQRPVIQVIKEYGEIPLVKGYANQLNQVFMNVIANAIDVLEDTIENTQLKIQHTNTEFISPTIRICTDTIDDCWVRVAITDNGFGIDESVRSRLFEPYFTTKPMNKGTGLGLSISHQIIQKHGGLLQCESQLGQGTTFAIQLPIELMCRD